MTIVAGTFENPQDLKGTIVNAAEQVFEDTVFNESIVPQNVGLARLQSEHKRASQAVRSCAAPAQRG